MAFSSARSSSGSSSHSGSSYPDASHSDTLLQLENIIEQHPTKESLPQSADALPHPADVPLHLVDASSSPPSEHTQPSPRPPFNPSAGRDVHIFDASNRGTSIGGLILTAGITNANLYAMVEIFVSLTANIFYGMKATSQ
jgi:hypothetical protein